MAPVLETIQADALPDFAWPILRFVVLFVGVVCGLAFASMCFAVGVLLLHLLGAL